MCIHNVICTLYKWKFKGTSVGTLPMFCIEKPFCACTAQKILRIVWRLQNRILVSVKIKLQVITYSNDNIWLSIVQPPGQLEGAGYKSAVS